MTTIPPVEVREIRSCEECVFYSLRHIPKFSSQISPACNLKHFINDIRSPSVNASDPACYRGYNNGHLMACPDHFTHDEIMELIHQYAQNMLDSWQKEV